MKNIFVLTFLFLLASGFTTSKLEAQKVGHLNSALILSEMPEVLAADAELETLQQQLVNQAQRKVEALQRDYQELVRKEQQGDLSPRQLQEEQNRLREKEMELQMEDQNIQSTLMRKREELLSPIIDKVQKAIEDVARENNFQYILDTSAGTVLYQDPAMDVADLVRDKLGLD
ncbi:MAG: OmpH family outer membrane protein [Saprospirales bacterium]|nr:MAG: OmpH family outer membrane protein [Saprospirales bacterium]